MTDAFDTLPIHAVLPDLLAALRTGTGAVLIAPPGAGKTTAVAPALIAEDWCTGQVLLLSPRRVAARAAAERMAQMLGERAGETIGYATRMDTRVGARTRVVVMTEAIFVNRIVAEPDLPGVSAVLFDEAHERHLDSDLGLALAIESAGALREDLRLLVMSATIDGSRFAKLLGPETPVIESEGKAHPLRIEWLGARAEQRIDEQVASAVLTAWREEGGDILAFLPGVGEIERVRERLVQRLPNTPVLPLHGQVDPAAQRLAIRRDAEGRRRIVLATSIAETSLTLDGVSVVVDAGLSRRAEFDIAAGTSHLVTHRASRAAADQRAGRAARQGPGAAYRLWEEGGHAGRRAYDPPEITTADLAPMVLSLTRWGESDPTRLPWLDPPPAPALSGAKDRLEALGALDADGRITALGEKLADLPMDPVHAALVLFGAEAGQANAAARIALLLQERGLGGRSEDLLHRLLRLDGERGGRADSARRLAKGWADRACRLVGKVAVSDDSPALFLARAMPGNVARRRDASEENWVSASGRGLILDPASPLAREEWLAIGDAQGQAKGARITAAAPLTQAEVERAFADRIERRQVLRWNTVEKRVEARLERRLGAIAMASGPDPQPDPDAMAELLLAKALEDLPAILPHVLMARAHHAGIAALDLANLQESARDWLLPLLHGRRDLAVPKGALTDALLVMVDWDARQRLDRVAPKEFTSPAGTQHAIDYAGEGAPAVELRVQALFGLDSHPMIGTEPLLLRLTSPAGRPIQSTRDLPGFWRGSWQDVAKDMKGRYPKHRWPDRPWEEAPSLKTKNAFVKGR
ncbi:ATP-dependent helicase HrpB [Croceicoccus naphthovorans]|uniref:ATP-dependent helicase n=1 Tax=Croceicoccus naphthovorans TaxID=1348774 RepID=A0A0G3XJT7_9SPHN|nr:ATP-dependent helicase HrpB [Croceicoccus naphthovorans]AKM10628.1 ATP-dependent helicase [Croceicoccus naphthovorans]MBB3988856.1 ATP-dependent helicase HrpB [Croceicoccus naphthovorans]